VFSVSPFWLELVIVLIMKILDTLSALVLDLISSVKRGNYGQADMFCIQIKKLNDIIDSDTVTTDLYFDTVFYGLFDASYLTTAVDRRWLITLIDFLKNAYEHHEYVISDICE